MNTNVGNEYLGDNMTDEEQSIERIAYALWTATGHRESDWIYMAPEVPRRQRYIAYAKAAYDTMRRPS